MKILKALLPLCIATATCADTTLTFTNKKDKVSMQMQFTNNMMRATSLDDNSAYMIYNANDKTFTTFMADQKQYFVMGEKEIEALSDIGAMINKELEKQLANVPEAQREMMRGMMESALKSRMPEPQPKAEYVLTGNSASFNGYDCEIVIKKSTSESAKFCVSDYKKLGMDSNEYAVLTSFQKTIEALAKKYGNDQSMDFSSLGQFIPVQYDNQNGESGTLSSVNHDELDPAIFSVPQGYTKMNLPFSVE